MFASTRPGSSLGLLVLLAALASCLLLPSSARAEDAAGGWRHTVGLYGMGAAIDGTAGGVVDQQASADANWIDPTEQGPLVGVAFSF